MSQILYDFLPVDAGGNVLGWAPTPANPDSTVIIVSDDQAPDSPTAGSLEFRGVFPPPDANGFSLMTAEVNFGDPTSAAGVRDFTGASTFHFWVRVISPPGTLRALQPFVQAGSFSSYTGTYQPFVTNIDNAWHEYQVSVAGQFYLNGVWKLGIQLFAPPPPVSDAGIAEGGDGGLGDEGGDLDAVAGDAEGAAPDADATPPDDAQPVTAADADAGVAADADGSAAPDAGEQEAGEQEAGEGVGADAGSPVIVRIDYVWVN